MKCSPGNHSSSGGPVIDSDEELTRHGFSRWAVAKPNPSAAYPSEWLAQHKLTDDEAVEHVRGLRCHICSLTINAPWRRCCFPTARADAFAKAAFLPRFDAPPSALTTCLVRTPLATQSADLPLHVHHREVAPKDRADIRELQRLIS